MAKMREQDYLNINYFVRTEPRINYMKTLLESILDLVDLEKDGQIVEVDGFRLKNIEDWLVKLPMSPLSNIGSISGYCNCHCEFCLEKGIPPGLIPYCRGPRRNLSLAETKTRLKYLDGETQSNIPRADTPFMEPLLNLHCLEILEAVKKAFPERFLWLETNGMLLTRDVIEKLAEIGVDEVLISLNSASPDVRGRVMQDPRPEIAIKAVPLLKKFQIPYTGSLVPLPSVPPHDIEQTIKYLDENEVLTTMVYLPGYTKYHPECRSVDEDFLRSTVSLVNGLRQQVRTPLILVPWLYAETDNLPRIIGTIRNSPAEKAGLKPGDIILKVSSFRVLTHFEANYYIGCLCNEPLPLQIERGGNTLDIELLPPDEYQYPYTRRTSALINQTGIVMHAGFQLTDLRRLVKILAKWRPKKVLFLSSRIMKPLFEEQLRRFCDLDGIDFRTEVPEHRFWGDNVFVGALYTVSDFVQHINRLLSEKRFVTDIIIIPSSPFSEWGRDLAGEVYAEVERRVGIPVEILNTRQTLD